MAKTTKKRPDEWDHFGSDDRMEKSGNYGIFGVTKPKTPTGRTSPNNGSKKLTKKK